MRLVIADTSPVNYLILIGHVDLLPRLFERVVLPGVVQSELSHPGALPPVRRWIACPPDWLEVVETPDVEPIAGLHKGEAAAIALAQSLQADLLLIDERDGVRVAKGRGLRVTGTLGVLDLAAERGMVDFDEAIQRLEATSFRRPAALLDSLRKKHGRSV